MGADANVKLPETGSYSFLVTGPVAAAFEPSERAAAFIHLLDSCRLCCSNTFVSTKHHDRETAFTFQGIRGELRVIDYVCTRGVIDVDLDYAADIYTDHALLSCVLPAAYLALDANPSCKKNDRKAFHRNLGQRKHVLKGWQPRDKLNRLACMAKVEALGPQASCLGDIHKAIQIASTGIQYSSVYQRNCKHEAWPDFLISAC